MTPADLNRRLLEWAGFNFTRTETSGGELCWHDPEGIPIKKPLPDFLTDHSALMGLLGRLTKSEERLFSASLIDLLGLDGDENGRFYFFHAITFATTPLPVLAECLWLVVGATEKETCK